MRGSSGLKCRRIEMVYRILLIVLLVPAWARAGNLLSNASLEDGEGRPAGWSAINYWGGKAEFAIDPEQAHSGKRSFRISCAESTQAFLYAAPVPVVAGETIEASAWVK